MPLRSVSRRQLLRSILSSHPRPTVHLSPLLCSATSSASSSASILQARAPPASILSRLYSQSSPQSTTAATPPPPKLAQPRPSAPPTTTRLTSLNRYRRFSTLIDPSPSSEMVSTTERLAHLRSLMKKEKVDVYGPSLFHRNQSNLGVTY